MQKDKSLPGKGEIDHPVGFAPCLDPQLSQFTFQVLRHPVSSAPLLPSSSAPLLPEGTVKQRSEASILADVGQRVNGNTMAR